MAMLANAEVQPVVGSNEPAPVASTTSLKKQNRCRSFHARYLELCRIKNVTPLPEIRKKNGSTTVLDFFGDKFGVTDWLLLEDALCCDQELLTLNIKLRKSTGVILEHMDTEKKAKLFRLKPVIYTKFIFSGVVNAIAHCIQSNKILKILSLEGLPLGEKYMKPIANVISSNASIREVSFQRSNITDKGCEAICSKIKYLENIEILNLSECGLTTKGALAVADMIKIQRINRYTEGWQKSLRYQDVDPDSIPGLRRISLARNPQIGDDGVKVIVETLKEDVWMKVIDMSGCGLTDRAANLIMECLEVNNILIDFNVRGNLGISKILQKKIREQLGKVDDGLGLPSDTLHQSCDRNGANKATKKPKETIAQFQERVKTQHQQLAFERELHKKAEGLNEKLSQQIVTYETQLEMEANAHLPEGYIVVKDKSLKLLIKERNEFQKLAFGDCIVDVPPLQDKEEQQFEIAQNQHEAQLEEYQIDPSASEVGSSFVDSIIDDQRNTLKVRKVKSEMKYVDPPIKDPTKKKESKSDHEIANETDFQLTTVRFETNIGDSTANNNRALTQQQAMQFAEYEGQKPGPSNNKIEIDDLSIGTSRSITSECYSSDSDTIRNTSDFCLPVTGYSRRSGTGEGQTGKKRNVSGKSPRSLFLGLKKN